MSVPLFSPRSMWEWSHSQANSLRTQWLPPPSTFFAKSANHCQASIKMSPRGDGKGLALGGWLGDLGVFHSAAFRNLPSSERGIGPIGIPSLVR